MQKAFLNFVVTPTWDLLKVIAPKSHAMARDAVANNLSMWLQIAETGDPLRVLNDEDPTHPTQAVHVSPLQSPFHSGGQTSWCGLPL